MLYRYPTPSSVGLHHIARLPSFVFDVIHTAIAHHSAYSRPYTLSSQYVCYALLQTGDLYEAVCNGCEISCQNCLFDEPPLVPRCENTMEHSLSPGGTTTVDMITINRGYWRATTSSRQVLACYNTDACLGGVTATSGYCLGGYEGPCEYRCQLFLLTLVLWCLYFVNRSVLYLAQVQHLFIRHFQTCS